MPLGLRCHCLLVFALALGLSPLAQPLLAAAIQPEDVVSPLVVMPLTSPNPVLGADDKVHLAYEIVLVNMAPGDIGLKKVETLDAASGAVLGTMEGDGLAQMLKFNGGNKGTTLSGAGSGILFMDVTLAKDATCPQGNQNIASISTWRRRHPHKEAATTTRRQSRRKRSSSPAIPWP